MRIILVGSAEAGNAKSRIRDGFLEAACRETAGTRGKVIMHCNPEKRDGTAELLMGKAEKNRNLAIVDSIDTLASKLESERVWTGRTDDLCIAIMGGDGTLSAVGTALARVYGSEEKPYVRLLGGGTMSTISRNFRNDLRGRSLYDRLEKLCLKAITAAVPDSADLCMIKVELDGQPGNQARYGAMVGLGIVTRILATYYNKGNIPDPEDDSWIKDMRASKVYAAKVFGKGMASLLVRGEYARYLTRREPMTLSYDENNALTDHFLTIMFSTVPEIAPFIRPFYRKADKDGFHMLVLRKDFKDRYFATNLHNLFLKRPMRKGIGVPLPMEELIDRKVQSATIIPASNSLYQVDGNVYHLPAFQRMTVSQGLTLKVIKGFSYR